MASPALLIATNNTDKLAEFRSLLQGCGWELVSPLEAGISLDVAESGASYSQNARLKALAFCRAAGLPALADDSGLEVDFLQGEPGALHHVRGWDGSGREERIDILLNALRGVPSGSRTARFRAVLVVAFPHGDLLEEEGVCEGVVAEQPAGSGGFGYDPVFYLPGLGRTMAELSPDEKNRVSHRAMAAARVCRRLEAVAHRA